MLAVMVLATNAYARTEQVSVTVPAIAGARPPPGPLGAALTTLDGKPPAPVVILLHGCGGIGRGATLVAWTERLATLGYASLILDSFGGRGVKTVCAPALQPLVTGVDRAGDVIAAARMLRGRSDVDGTRIAVIGFSHGGGTAVAVTRREFADADYGLLKASVDYYGPCRDANAHGRTPLLVLAGTADTWGDPAQSCALFSSRLSPGQVFAEFTYPDVVHAFDNALLTSRIFNQGHPMQYDAAAANDSYARVKDFLSDEMK
jgi:dienelactone hydrolase